MGPAGSKTNPGQTEPTMNAKITKTEAAALAYDDACRAYTNAGYRNIRIRNAVRAFESGAALTWAQEDEIYDACRIKVGNRAYNMTLAELAPMAKEVAAEIVKDASALCDKLGEEADRLERAAARRAARKAAAVAA
jgi:hypothetical protein